MLRSKKLHTTCHTEWSLGICYWVYGIGCAWLTLVICDWTSHLKEGVELDRPYSQEANTKRSHRTLRTKGKRGRPRNTWCREVKVELDRPYSQEANTKRSHRTLRTKEKGEAEKHLVQRSKSIAEKQALENTAKKINKSSKWSCYNSPDGKCFENSTLLYKLAAVAIVYICLPQGGVLHMIGHNYKIRVIA